MKKSLLILGLLVCSAGVVLADEVVSTDIASNVTQQVEVQNSLDRTNFDKMDKNRKFNKSLSEQNDKDKIKFDKSINDKKFKNLDKKKPTINDKKFNDRIQGRKPAPDIYGRRPERMGFDRKPAPNNYYKRNLHNHRYDRYGMHSHNMRKSPSRHAYNNRPNRRMR